MLWNIIFGQTLFLLIGVIDFFFEDDGQGAENCWVNCHICRFKTDNERYMIIHIDDNCDCVFSELTSGQHDMVATKKVIKINLCNHRNRNLELFFKILVLCLPFNTCHMEWIIDSLNDHLIPFLWINVIIFFFYI